MVCENERFGGWKRGIKIVRNIDPPPTQRFEKSQRSREEENLRQAKTENRDPNIEIQLKICLISWVKK